MAKRFGKLVLFSAIAGAAAAGTYYYLQKKNEAPKCSFDDIDDFEDYDDGFDDDIDFADNAHNKNRSYVSLDLDGAKEIIGEKVIETIDKTKEKIVQFNVAEKLDKAKEYVESTIASVASAEEDAQYTDVSDLAPDEAAAESGEASSYEEAPEADETEEFFDDDEL